MRPLSIHVWLLTVLVTAAGASAVRCAAQPFSFAQVPVPGGEHGNLVTAIAQDRNGFLWLASWHGLHRYDGYEVVTFVARPDDPGAWPFDFLESLLIDAQGVLWIGGTNGGLIRFDPETEERTVFLHDPADPASLSPGTVTALIASADGGMWIGTDGGLDRFDPVRGVFTHYRHDPADPASLSHDRVRALLLDRNGTLWVGTGNPWESPAGEGGLNRFDAETGTFTRYRHDPDAPTTLASDHVSALYEDRGGVLWVGTDAGGLHTLDPATGTFTRHDYAGTRLRPADVRAPRAASAPRGPRFFREDASGALWMGTFDEGLVRRDPRTGALTHHGPDAEAAEGLSAARVWTMLEAEDGTLWFATHGAGLHKALPRPHPFEHVALPDDDVRALYEASDGALWIGTDGGGLLRLDEGDATPVRFRHDPADPASLSHDDVRAVLEASDGALWIGTRDGLNRLDPATGVCVRYVHDPADPTSLPHDMVRALLIDRYGGLWVGTEAGGIGRMDPTTGTFTNYTHDPDDSTSLSNVHVLYGALLEDRDGFIWIGTNNGLNRFDPRTQTFTRYSAYTLHAEDAYRRRRFSGIAQDRRGVIWAGTMFNGLYYLPPGADRLVAYDTLGRTLRGLNLYGLLLDEADQVWLSTWRGPMRIGPDRASLRLFERSGTPPAGTYTYGAYHAGRSGTFYLGGHGGFTRFTPATANDNAVPPRVHLRAFQTSLPAAAWRTFAPGDSLHALTLRHSQNDFAVAFVGVHYQEPAANRYAYRLEPLHDDWIDIGTERRVVFSELPPGHYTFHLRAANADGVWSTTPTTLALHVRPPWWRTWWAYGAYVLLIGFALSGFISWRVFNLRRQNEALEALVSERTAQVASQADRLREMDEVKSRFFADLSHEFRTPLTLILGPLDDLLQGADGAAPTRHALAGMHRQARRLLHLIDQLLDLAKLDAGRLHLQIRHHDLIPLLRDVVLAFAPAAEAKEIALTFQPGTDRLDLYVDREKLEHVFYNLLSNALKFTAPGGKVHVAAGVAEEGRTAEVTVRDTGTGIPPEQLDRVFDRFHQSKAGGLKGTGIGLALVRELVQLHGGAVRVTSAVRFGSTFTVHLPIVRTDDLPGAPESHLPPADTADPPLHAVAPVVDVPPASSILLAPPEALPEAPLVLIVEDDAEVRAYLRTCLAPSFRVAVAADGAEGLTLARVVAPDLVISDVTMPEMDGIELTRRLKSDEDLRHLPLILLTARASVEARLQGLGAGADDYVEKPFHAEELRARVRNLIAGRRRLREQFSGELVLRPSEVVVSSAEAAFLEHAVAVVERHLTDAQFGVDALAEEVGLSARHLQRKLRDLTGESPSRFIRRIRLERAAQLLERRAATVAEIAYAVGYSKPAYFSKLFAEAYGMPPSAYADRGSA